MKSLAERILRCDCLLNDHLYLTRLSRLEQSVVFKAPQKIPQDAPRFQEPNLFKWHLYRKSVADKYLQPSSLFELELFQRLSYFWNEDKYIDKTRIFAVVRPRHTNQVAGPELLHWLNNGQNIYITVMLTFNLFVYKMWSNLCFIPTDTCFKCCRNQHMNGWVMARNVSSGPH